MLKQSKWKKNAQAYFDKWYNILRLGDWKVVLILKDEKTLEEEEDGRAAYNVFYRTERTSIIVVFPPSKPEESWLHKYGYTDYSPDELENSIIHELLHLVLADVESYGIPKEELEKTIHQLASAYIAADKDKLDVRILNKLKKTPAKTSSFKRKS